MSTTTSTATVPSPGSIRAALTYPGFRRLIGALAVSQAGDWLYNLALLAVVYQRTHSTAWLAATTAARVVPIVVLGPFGGAIAGRWDRRRVMVVSDVARAGCMIVLALVAAWGLPIALAPIMAGLSTGAGSPYPSCVAASTPRLVDDVDLPGANAARSAVGMLCIIAGPGVGALLLLLGSPALALLLNAATFAVSAWAVCAIRDRAAFRPASRGRDARTGPVLRDVAEGAAALWRNGIARRLVGADVMCSGLYGAHTVLLVLLARHLGAGATGYGLLLAAIGVGGVVGTGFAGRAAGIAQQRRVLTSALLCVALPAVLLPVAPILVAAMCWAFLIGAGSVIVEVSTETALQRSLPEDVFASAYGVALPVSLGGIVLGSLVAAPLAAYLGLAGALAVAGAAVAAYALVISVPPHRLLRRIATSDTLAG
jgi:predicted MFS family arabinose efflux permease